VREKRGEDSWGVISRGEKEIQAMENTSRQEDIDQTRIKEKGQVDPTFIWRREFICSQEKRRTFERTKDDSKTYQRLEA